MANRVVGQRPTCRACHELRALEDEEGGEVVGSDPAQPVEAATKEILDAVVLGRQLNELAKIPRQVELGLGRQASTISHNTDISVKLTTACRFIHRDFIDRLSLACNRLILKALCRGM
jgi:hypothetical protein